jgi:hypothetical protein
MMGLRFMAMQYAVPEIDALDQMNCPAKRGRNAVSCKTM